MTLQKLLLSERSQLDKLAETWQQAGATAFGIAQNEQMLATWISGDSALPSLRLIAPISAHSKPIGELWVAGLNDPVSQAHLNNQASWLGRSCQLADEFDAMTGELIDTQDQLLALYDLNQSLRIFFDLPEMLDAITHKAMQLVKTQSAFIIVDSHNGERQSAQAPSSRLPKSTLNELFKLTSANPRHLLTCVDTDGVPSQGNDNVLVVPITIQKQVRAALGWVEKSEGNFTSPDIKLARAIAEHASGEIEKVLLYQETIEQARLKTELDLARNIQVRLVMHQLPRVPGLDLYAHMVPALQVGGDFFDLIASPGRPVFLTLGDVSGKGMPAALVMSMLRAALRAKARFMPNTNPAEILHRLTEELYDDFTELSMFATLFIAQFDPGTRLFTYANAGHAPVIHVPANSAPRLLQADAPPLGVLPLSVSQNTSVYLQTGDLIIITSDGFSEASNSEGELFGIERLLDLVEQLRSHSAQEIAKTLFETVAQFSTGRMDDDQTALLLKYQ